MRRSPLWLRIIVAPCVGLLWMVAWCMVTVGEKKVARNRPPGWVVHEEVSIMVMEEVEGGSREMSPKIRRLHQSVCRTCGQQLDFQTFEIFEGQCEMCWHKDHD